MRRGMSARIRDLRVFKMDLALREPFRISFKTYTCARNCFVVLETDEGVYGYGEGSPDKPITGDTQDEALLFIAAAAKKLRGKPLDIDVIHRLLSALERELGFRSQAGKAAIDMACYDALGKLEGKPVYKLLGAEKPEKALTTLTIGIKPIEETVETARRYAKEYERYGLKRIKLKLSGDPDEDLERVIRVSEVFAGELTLDANQSYRNPEKAIAILEKMYESIGGRLILVEQPTPKEDLEALKKVSERSPIPVFADESAATLEDVVRVAEAKAASGINIKLQKVGGIYYAVKAAEKAREAGLKLMVGCNEETHVAISAAINFAAATPGVVGVDLDSDILLFDLSITRGNPLETFIEGARLPRDSPGLGVELSDWFKALLNGEIKLEEVTRSS